MATFGGEVEVPVVPDTSKFPELLRAKMDPAAAKAAERIGQQMGQIIARQVADGVARGLSGGRATASGAKAGQEFGKGFSAAANASIKAGLKDQRLKVLGDFTDVTRGVAKARAELSTLRGQRVAIKGDADLGKASAELAAFNAEVSKTDGRTATVNVDVDGGAATAQIAGIGAAAGGSTSRMQALILAAAALGPALVPVGAAGVAAMAGIGAAAVAAASGVGVLALALTPVIGAFQAVTKAQEGSSAAASTGATRAIALANAQDSLKQAVLGVARAKRDAAQAAEDADRKIADSERGVEEAVRASIRVQNDGANRVAEARRRLADQVRRAADSQVQSDRKIADAERSLASAQRDVLKAQEDLNEARGLAARDAEDLASRVAGGRLDERDAVLDLADAEAALASASDEDRARAQLGYDRAVQRLQDIQRENKRLAAEQAASNEAGVEGSDRVTSAREALAAAEERAADAARASAEAAVQAGKDREDAAQGVADAERAVAEAVIESAERQREAALKVAAARRDLSDAVKAEQDQQVKSAEAIAAAQQQVVQAQRGVQSASISAGAAGSSAMDEARKKLAALTPEGRAFVAFLKDEFVPAVKGLSGVAQTGLLPGLQDGMRSLIPLLPVFRDLVGNVAAVMGSLFREAGKALAGPFWRDFFQFIADTAGPTLLTMGRTLGNVGKGFAGLFQAFQPVADKFGAGLLRLSDRFAEFGAGASKNPAFQKFIDYIIVNGPLVVDTIGSIFRAIGNIIKSMAPFGPVILAVVGGFSDLIAAVPPGVLEGVALAVIGVVLAMKALAVIVPIVNIAIGILNGTILVNPIALIVIALIALGAALVAAYQHSETFRAVVDKVWDAVKTAISVAWESVIKPTLEALWGFIKDTLVPIFQTYLLPVIQFVWQAIGLYIQTYWAVISAVFQAIVGFVREALIPAFQTYLLPVIQLVWNLIKTAIQIAWSVIQVIWAAIGLYIRNVLAPVFTWLYDHVVKPVWDKIYAAISVTWETLIKPVLSAVGNFIRDNVAPAFEVGVAAIKTAWDKIIDISKIPVRFVIERVINDGIIGTWNRIAGWFGVAPVDRVQLPKGFADGGPISLREMQARAGGGLLSGPGSGTSDSIIARVSDGEYVLRAAAVKKLGIRFLDLLNQADRLDISGDLAGLIIRGAFADGGPVEAAKSWLPSVDPKPYVWGGVGPDGYDCSGLTGEVFNRLTGSKSYQRRFITTSDFGALGFKPGRGLYTIGVNPEHMVGNLGGLGFEARSTATGIFVGNSAQKTSAFPREYYLSSLGGSEADANRIGLSLLNPVGSVRALFERVLSPLVQLEGTPFGALVSALPRRIVDAAMGWLSSAWHPGFADGGRVLVRDQGGPLPPGLSTVFNGTGRNEHVFRDDQVARLAGSGGTTVSADVKVYNPVPETASESTTRIMRRLAMVGPRG